MRITTLASLALGGILGALVPACGLEVGDLNNPGLDELENNPTAVSIGAACTGLLIGSRTDKAPENGMVLQLGVLGREAYCFDSADPRFWGELIGGTLNSGSPFGGAFWAFPYANIRLGNVIFHATDKIAELADADRGASNGLTMKDKSAVRGFTRTIQAVDLLEVVVTHDTNGAVIDTDRDLHDPLGPIVDKPTALARIAKMLDDAQIELQAADETFPFQLSEGFAGFNTPATFIKFNRALKARVSIYREDYTGALDALAMSFLDDAGDGGTPPFDLGVYYTYSTKTGDVTNGLINPNIYAHPSLESGAARNGATIDNRYSRKVDIAKDSSGQPKPGSVKEPPLASTLAFSKLYPSPASPVALIRNEELILIKAEALFFSNPTLNGAAAVTELNIVRQKSGGLPALVGIPNRTTFINELLYERRYSLMFEGGHRWIDLRRFNQPIPLDNPNPPKKDVANIRYPIPLQECNARPTDEPACAKGSTD